MFKRYIQLEVVKPDLLDNEVILDTSGTWGEIAQTASERLEPGQYAAIRTFHHEAGIWTTFGILRISDETVEWAETTQRG